MKEHYRIENGKLARTSPFCPRCGAGVFMADKGEWWSCGKCGDRYNKKTIRIGTNPRSAHSNQQMQASNIKTA
jgi:small subunit ribosomal protein S27Ae